MRMAAITFFTFDICAPHRRTVTAQLDIALIVGLQIFLLVVTCTSINKKRSTIIGTYIIIPSDNHLHILLAAYWRHLTVIS